MSSLEQNAIVEICRAVEDKHNLLAAYTVLLLSERGVMGRKKLAEYLGVGEATARTIVGKLKRKNVLTASRSGARLTEQGLALAEVFGRLVRPAKTKLSEKLGENHFSFIVRGCRDKVGSGVKERDEAVKGGADGALILLKRDGKLVFPGTLEEFRGVEDVSPQPSDGDCLVIAWAKNRADSLLGSLRASVYIACRQ